MSQFMVGWFLGVVGTVFIGILWYSYFKNEVDSRDDHILKASPNRVKRPNNETARKFNDPRYRAMKQDEFKSKAAGGISR